MEQKKPDMVLRALEQAGYAAYFVGGCVRDALLGREIHDWDVTTSARPEQVMALFDHCVPTGVQHGTVTVLLDGAQAEVTTFRRDGAYHDGRHPDAVAFVSSLREDLLRRDFTINAMAQDLRGKIYDVCGGQDDLRHGILRCVGVPEARFREDALRMLRAVRFAAQLGFVIEPETERAVRKCAPLCAALSRERVRDEMEKTLQSPRPERLGEMLKAGLLTACGLEGRADLSWLAALPAGAARWAGLRVLLPALDPAALRLPSALGARMTAAAQAYRPGLDALALKKILAAHGWEVAELTAALDGKTALLEKIRASGDCVTLRQLAVRGSDFPERKGTEVGALLRTLLAHVLEHPEDNTRQTLLALAKKL